MEESETSLRFLCSSVPSLELAKIAQEIGFRAWGDAMPKRRSELRHTFDPFRPKYNADRLLVRMQSKEGVFRSVTAYAGELAVGYAWAADDISGGFAARALKKATGKKPYAWIAQVNVLPEFQGRGIGSNLVSKALEPFNSTQKPTAYVFEENPKALRWFTDRGFAPKPEEPTEKYDYFGESAYPVKQFRLEAESVSRVITLINSHRPQTRHYPE